MTLQLKPGDVISYQTCGGGGYGNPFEREPSQVLDDVINGKVSVERARTEYGVEIDRTGRAIDESATRRLREAAQ